jgi:hypothetical protein
LTDPERPSERGGRNYHFVTLLKGAGLSFRTKGKSSSVAKSIAMKYLKDLEFAELSSGCGERLAPSFTGTFVFALGFGEAL